MSGNDLKAKAEHYLEFFSIDFEADGAAIHLEAGAPAELHALMAELNDVDPACVFEGLSALAESEDTANVDFDEKICPIDMMNRLRKLLG